MSFAIIALLVVAGWVIFVALVIAFCMGSSRAQTPRAPLSQDAAIWFKHAAKVAHRRHA